MTSHRKLAVAVTALGLTIAGCLSVGTEEKIPPLDPVKMEAYIQRNFANIPNLTGALGRVIQAATTGSAPGVTFHTTSDGVAGTVTVDVKGDGTDIANVDATITYNNPSQGIFGGAKAVVTSLTSPNLTGSANADVAVAAGGSSITFSAGAADLQYTNGPELQVSNATIAVTTSASLGGSASFVGPITILGSADFHSGGKSGTIYFESDGSGGWRIRVVSPDFATFTVP